jgi:hypothetical protein
MLAFLKGWVTKPIQVWVGAAKNSLPTPFQNSGFPYPDRKSFLRQFSLTTGGRNEKICIGDSGSDVYFVTSSGSDK